GHDGVCKHRRHVAGVSPMGLEPALDTLLQHRQGLPMLAFGDELRAQVEVVPRLPRIVPDRALDEMAIAGQLALHGLTTHGVTPVEHDYLVLLDNVFGADDPRRGG